MHRLAAWTQSAKATTPERIWQTARAERERMAVFHGHRVVNLAGPQRVWHVAR
jgi:hypothetical protein